MELRAAYGEDEEVSRRAVHLHLNTPAVRGCGAVSGHLCIYLYRYSRVVEPGSSKFPIFRRDFMVLKISVAHYDHCGSR